jgi:putative transposase
LGLASSGWLSEQGTKRGDKIGPNPTDRAKPGTKRSLITERDGGPTGVVLEGANRNDHTMLEATIEAIVVERPEPTPEHPQNLSLDKAYDNEPTEQVLKAHGYTAHIRRIGEEKLDQEGKKRYPARRWVVERTLAWLNKCRAIVIRWDKKACNYLGMIKLACALLWYRRYWHLAHLE